MVRMIKVSRSSLLAITTTVACLLVLKTNDVIVSVNAFVPAEPTTTGRSSQAIIKISTTRTTTTSLNLISDQEMFGNTVSLQNGGVGYRNDGRGFYPNYYSPRGGSLAYNNGGRYSNLVAGPEFGYSNGFGYDYGYRGYHGYGPYDFGGTVHGNSRRTFSTSQSDSSTVQLETDGRPLNANVEVWQGAGNSPAKMRLYSEDGYLRPWVAGFANTPRGGYSTAISVNNEASQSFPIRANPIGGGGPSPYGGGGYGMGMMLGGTSFSYTGSSRRFPTNVDGNGALRTFSVRPGPVVVEIWSENYPFYADVELWDGPNNVKQAAEIYSDSGFDRPWSAIVENPRGGTIAIRNVGPLEYPFKVSVEPIGMGGMGMGMY